MTREEFLDQLAAKLAESLPPSVVRSQVRYYQGYLDAAVRSGKTEEEATAELGDPILIARSILESPHEGSDFAAEESDSYAEGSYQGMNQTRETDAADPMTDAVPVGDKEKKTDSDASEDPDQYGTRQTEARETTSERPGGKTTDERSDGAGEEMAGSQKTASSDQPEHVTGRTEPKGGRWFHDPDGRLDVSLIMTIILVVIIVVALVRVVMGTLHSILPVFLLVLVVLLIWFMLTGNRRS